MQHFRRLLSASILVLCAAPALAGSPVPVSGPSPLAGCNISGEPGVNHLNGLVEPWIAVNPISPTEMIAGWQQDRWANGGARGHVSAYSVDGGKTWQSVVVRGTGKCAGGTGAFAFDRISDPWVAISPGGTSYFLSLGVNRDGSNAIVLNRSMLGGMYWDLPVALRRDSDPKVFNDKPSITADPRDSRYVYAVWDQLVDLTGESGSIDQPGESALLPNVARMARQRHAAHAALQASGAKPVDENITFTGYTYFARTADGGRTWEPSRVIYGAGGNAQSFGNQVVVLRDGSVLVFYMEIYPDGTTDIRVLKSTDRGASFGAPSTAATAIQVDWGTRMPDSLKSVRDAGYLFDVAYDRETGRLYLVWQDARQDSTYRVAFAMSSDGGAAWSAPAIISKTPKNANLLRTQAIIPSVAVSADSRVHVTYYDFRKDTPKTARQELADYWAISCRPGSDCRQATSWGYEARLTPRSFNMLNAPVMEDGGYFLGDYQGLAQQGTSVRALFTMPIARNVTRIVTSLIK